MTTAFIPTKEKTKLIRQALKSRFGLGATAKTGAGTASSWINARVLINRPWDCVCDELPAGRCAVCRSVMDKVRGEANRIAHGVLVRHNMEFSTYVDDMGTKNECFILEVGIKRN